MKEPTAVANHLLAPDWDGDKVNDFRRAELTSHWRLARGEELAREITARAKRDPKGFGAHGPEWMASALRDKRVDGQLLPGNRAAIDALIATHAVVYDTAKRTLYVSAGPSLTGKFLGFDLPKSFAAHRPVPNGEIAADREVTPAEYPRYKADIGVYEKVVQTMARKTGCDAAASLRARGTEHYAKHLALGLLAEKCGGDIKGEFRKALALQPAYARERRLVEEHLKGAQP
jgi:hypothetical protein